MLKNELGSRILRRLGALFTALCAAVAVALVLAPAPALAADQEVTLKIPVTFAVEGDEAATTPTYTAELAAVGTAPMPGNGGTTVSSVGAGSATFGEITYTTPGVYRYTIKQTTPAMSNWTLDPTTYYVKVTCAWEQGSFKATVVAYTSSDDSGAKATEFGFVNTYVAPEGELQVDPGMKLMYGRELAAGDFTFELVDGQGNVVATTVNAAGEWSEDAKGIKVSKGSFMFDSIVLTQSMKGQTLTYTVREVQGNDANVTYDKSVYQVSFKVAVVDGVLEATDVSWCKTVDVDGSQIAQPVEIENLSDLTAGLVFVNTYEEPAAPDEPSEPTKPAASTTTPTAVVGKLTNTGDATTVAGIAACSVIGVAVVAAAVVVRRRNAQ